MSLERQPATTKLDADVHEALVAICDIEGVTIAKWIERVIVPVIAARVRNAKILADQTRGLEITGKVREQRERASDE